MILGHGRFFFLLRKAQRPKWSQNVRWSHGVFSFPTSLSSMVSGALKPPLPWQHCHHASSWGLGGKCVCVCVLACLCVCVCLHVRERSSSPRQKTGSNWYSLAGNSNSYSGYLEDLLTPVDSVKIHKLKHSNHKMNMKERHIAIFVLVLIVYFKSVLQSRSYSALRKNLTALFISFRGCSH